MKSRIVEELGQAEILLPGLVAEGLRANDRAKVRLSALQAAPATQAILVGRSPTSQPNAAAPASMPLPSNPSSQQRERPEMAPSMRRDSVSLARIS
jgi:hypothetical protein